MLYNYVVINCNDLFMKNIIKTFAYGFTAVILFGFSASPVLANAVFNNHPNDFATVRVSNYTDNPGSTSSWSSYVSADAGDIVSVAIYYHNNGTENANSTKLKINNGQNIGAGYTHTISGSVSALNAGMVSGSATINLSSSQTLTYIPGSALWYPNQTTTNEVPPIGGQNGTEIFSGTGINIGTITPGWSSQGSFVVQYQVSEAQTIQSPIVTTNSYSLNGNQATLNGYVNGQGNNPYTWFVYGTSSNLGVGSLATAQDYQASTSTSFSETVSVNSNTTYYYKACALVNGGGTDCGSILSFYTGSNTPDPEPEDDTEFPIVTTDSASSISYYSAVLNGDVQYTGNDTVYSLKFHYGTNANNLSNMVSAFPGSLNNPGSFSFQVSNLSPDTTYYYKACGTNSIGQDCGNIVSFTTDDNDDNDDDDDDDNVDLEVKTLSAQSITTHSAVLRGDIEETSGEDVVRYFEYGDDDDDLDYTLVLPGVTDNEGQFQALLTGLQSGETYYFRACIEADDTNDEDCGNVRSFTTNGGYQPPISVGNMQAITSYATGISSTSAVLNGASINSTSNGTVSYFQYGTSSNLGNTTATKSVNAGQTLYNAQAITGLVPNTTYYYRIVTGNVLGNVSTFKTSTNQTVVITPTPVTNPGGGTGGAGIVYLALDITPDFENVYEGDVINFDVDYRNLYNGDLEDVVIQVMFPEEIEFRKSTAGFYSAPNRALIVDLGDLDDNEDGTFLVQGEVLGRFNNRDSVITIAEGTYDHPTISNAQGSSTAYALNTILLDGSTLGAFAWGSGFFPGIFGWLILILLILLIIWISRRMYVDHQDRKNEKPTLQIN